MMRSNVEMALYGMQEVLAHVQDAGRGHVVTISSMLWRAPFALQRSADRGAKHVLNALTANFRTEVQATHPASTRRSAWPPGRLD
jgi:NADP-dependent 3-hydroxy acid dehydrogenase YdfG